MACFKDQQAAIKGYLYGIGQPKLAPSVAFLLQYLNAPSDFIDKAKFLDKMCITTRYPNAWSSGSPDYYYIAKEAEDAIKYAEDIIKYVEELSIPLRKE